MAWWYVASKKNKEGFGQTINSADLFHRVLVVSTNIMEKEKELCEEPEEMKEEKDTGVYAKMAKDVNDARKNPPEEGV